MTGALTGNETKKMLAASLKRFMALKPLHKISIKEIVEDCNVNRQTFYYHFQDINDLVAWTFREEALILMQDHENFSTWEDGARQIFRYIQDNREICLCALNSLGHQHLKQFFYADLYSIISKIIDSLSEGLVIQEEYKDFLTYFYTVTFAGLAESWLTTPKEKELPPDELIQMIHITIEGNIAGALTRFAEAGKRPMTTENQKSRS